jgi:D-amino-acid dehydrogenase
VKVLTGQYGVRTAFGFDASRAAFDRDAVILTDADGRQLRARRLVVALGPDARRFLARLGAPAPILPMKGYSITAPLGPAAPQISITDTARRLVFCRLGAGMRIAGGAELGVWDAAADRAWLARLLEAAKASLPQAADYSAVAKGWAGLRPMTPDGLPVIARPHERLVVNVGHGMLGWTLAMGSAERAAALVLDGAESGAVRA